MNPANASCYAYDGNFGANAVGARQTVPCNLVPGSPNLFTGVVQYSQYGYNQISWVVYTFLAINILSLLVHIGQGIWWKTWWTLPTLAAGAAVEVIGWGGRLWSLTSEEWTPHFGGMWVSEYNGFIMQIVCLVIGPTFFSAANYILLNRLIRLTGGKYSSVTPKSFAVAFIVFDIACLVVQAVGGGIAGTANTSEDADTGAYIMTGGVCLQLLITVIFVGLYLEFIYRFARRLPARKQYDVTAWFKCGAARRRSREARDTYTSDKLAPLDETAEFKPVSGRVWLITGVLGLATVLITIRGVYRSIELTNGWRGEIAVDQPLFLGLDPLLMTILVVLYNIFHPAIAVSGQAVREAEKANEASEFQNIQH